MKENTGCSKCNRHVVNQKYQLCDDCNYYRLHNETKYETQSRKLKEKETGQNIEVKVFCLKHPTRIAMNRKYKLCEECNRERLISIQTPIIRVDKGIKKEKKTPETELDDKVMREIWNERPHISEVSGRQLGDLFSRIYCSHILTKGAYGRMRRVKENIKLVTPDEHHEWEFGDRDKLRLDPKWKWVFEREQEMIQRYYQ